MPRAEARHDLLYRFLPDIDGTDACPGGGEALHNRSTDASGGAGDDHTFTIEAGCDAPTHGPCSRVRFSLPIVVSRRGSLRTATTQTWEVRLVPATIHG